VFLLLLCNDRAVLGPWVNPSWLNTAAAAVVGVLLALSALLTAVTLFPGLPVPWPAAVTAGALAAGLGALAGSRLGSEPGTAATDGAVPSRATGTMPPIETLPPPSRAGTRNAGLLVLRAYLLLAAAGVAVRIAQLIAGS
jgi:hypothetical protein